MEDEGFFNGKYFLPREKQKNVKRMVVFHGRQRIF